MTELPAQTPPEPKLRKPLGVILMIALIALYVLIVTALSDPISTLPIMVQTPIWIALGIAWIFPLKPLVRWIEVGRWS
ncbi:hypothetical protein B5C34_11265 [Pacificimonas flava]|uniref:DUF2842 domain-containing protein n=2 Tax=Pacificimonas TaxID=1960290 RepID=A0A219B6G8_9SPHN|nr:MULTISPECIES: DUF2842 domain-containing protein [Pacificimonas]MBZ6378753.1 DUF2842 domain-containing protein [Pacificimonas aurantium]OWV33982.1 hypothetical protein B5C34_11265 [Pacificimonas flava]